MIYLSHLGLRILQSLILCILASCGSLCSSIFTSSRGFSSYLYRFFTGLNLSPSKEWKCPRCWTGMCHPSSKKILVSSWMGLATAEVWSHPYWFSEVLFITLKNPRIAQLVSSLFLLLSDSRDLIRMNKFQISSFK